MDPHVLKDLLDSRDRTRNESSPETLFRHRQDAVFNKVGGFLDVLSIRQKQMPDCLAVARLGADSEILERLTYRQLWLKSCSLGARLAESVAAGDRAIVLAPTDILYASALFACFHAGLIAVPAYPPNPKRPDPRIDAILAASRASTILAQAEIITRLRGSVATAGWPVDLRWIALEDAPTTTMEPTSRQTTDIAFLQFTSGSTATPRGVCVSHRNLLAQCHYIHTLIVPHPDDITVSWLPLYHDMGLVGGLLAPIYCGIPTYIFAAQEFMGRPLRWLSAMSRHGATMTSGPNFAFELCVDRIADRDVHALDLSKWRIAFNGAEPINANSLDRFAEKFVLAGFRPESFFPCYGMAETTLMISGSGGRPIKAVQADTQALKRGRVEFSENSRARRIVSCGTLGIDYRVAIVNPETLKELPPLVIGEIWVRGSSVACGYWNAPAETAHAFEARLVEGEGPFLRTGDLGFIHEGELYITGRRKDVIIIQGANYFPQDIEIAVKGAHRRIREVIAFGSDEPERLIVVGELAKQNVARQGEYEKILTFVRCAIGERMGLGLSELVLINPRMLPRTSSGKVRRAACKLAWQSGELPAVWRWCASLDDKQQLDRFSNVDSGEKPVVSQNSGGALLATPGSRKQPPFKSRWPLRTVSAESNLLWRLQDMVAQELRQSSPDLVRVDQSLRALGLDSLSALNVKIAVEREMGREIPLNLIQDDPTLLEFARRLALLDGDGDNEPKLSCENTAASAETSDTDRAVSADAASSGGIARAPAEASGAGTGFALSLMFFSADEAETKEDRYRFVREASRIADARGFEAVWIPERHFHRFGGLFPNPAVVAAAIASETRHIRIRAGSVVLPLHDPIRVYEEWAVVDNLSRGRVDLSFATGWDADSFCLAPSCYANRVERTFAGIDEVTSYWAGKPAQRKNGHGETAEVVPMPRPIQPKLRTWLTATRDPHLFQEAGSRGFNVLTALLFQTVEELSAKIAIYRQARQDAGLEPAAGRVTVMLHTFIGRDSDEVLATVREPLTRYLRTSINLWRKESESLDALSATTEEDVVRLAFERYYRSSGLFGTPAAAVTRIDRLQEIGVNEIACLIDFGVPAETVVQNLGYLAELRRLIDHPKKQPETKSPGLSLITNISGSVDLTERYRPTPAKSRDIFQRPIEFNLFEQIRDAGLMVFYQEFGERKGPYVKHNGKWLLQLGSLDYLGLTADERVRRAAAEAALREGASRTGSRLHNGTTKEQLAFEHQLADFLGREDAVVFATGYQAQVGLVSGLLDPDSTAVLDEYSHASLYDGALISRCRIARFKHNDPDDLNRILSSVSLTTPVLVIAEGIYSNEGDLAPLPDIRAVCSRHGVRLALDEAHGLGVLGATGKGAEEEFKMMGEIDILTGTFSKSLASIGGWIAGPTKVIDWIRFNGRSMLFSAAIAPSALAAAAKSLEILAAEPERVAALRNNAVLWKDELQKRGLDIGSPSGPIVPIFIGDDLTCLAAARELIERGVYANAVLPPSAPRGKALLRTCVTALHEAHHLSEAAQNIALVVKAVTGISLQKASRGKAT
jgi:natural product biosynthesis luciferase-like monooxygenase protein